MAEFDMLDNNFVESTNNEVSHVQKVQANAEK